MSLDDGIARRTVIACRSRLLPGERAEMFATDVAGCECVLFRYMGIPCTVVAQTAPRSNAPGQYVTRCLECGVAWRMRQYRTDPLVIVSVGSGSEERAA